MEAAKVRASRRSICILWHLKSKRILCVTRYTSTAQALMSSGMEMGFNIVSRAKPILHSEDRVERLRRIPPEELPNYLFHRQSGTIVKIENPKPLTEKQKNACILLAGRARYLRRVTRVVSQARKRVAPSELYGAFVDQIRREQALKFRASGYDEALIQECLFVFQYAQVKKITARAAADEIIFRFSLFEADLWKTEEVKLKYYDLFANAANLEDLHDIFQDFIREYYLNARV